MLKATRLPYLSSIQACGEWTRCNIIHNETCGLLCGTAYYTRCGCQIYITNGSSKRVKCWWQAGYGGWFAKGSERNFSAQVLTHERQSMGRGELRGVLQALQARGAGEKMVVVLDSEYVYKGIIEWCSRWQHHGWRVKNRDVGHGTCGRPFGD